MIQLSSFLWGMVAMFAFIGFMRGWAKELLGLAGIVLAVFALEQFRDVLLAPLAAGAAPAQQFYLYAGILLVITFFAYQVPQRFEGSRRGRGGARENLQEGLLGAVLGGFNGYLVVGSLWFYMDSLGYPLTPFVSAPSLTSASALMVEQLPQVWLLEGNILTLLVVLLFLFVVIVLV